MPKCDAIDFRRVVDENKVDAEGNRVGEFGYEESNED